MNDKKIIENILFAQQDLEEHITKEELQMLISQIDTVDKLIGIDENQAHQLWRWLPAILFNKFGFECYQKLKPKNCKKSSIIMLNPYHISELKDLTNALYEEEFIFSIHKFTFSCSLIAQVYGGFPWYPSYKKLCQELNIFGKTGHLFIVKEDKNIDVVESLRLFKNENRHKFGQQIKRNYEFMEYPGVLNSFHTPNYIENNRHIKALINSMQH